MTNPLRFLTLTLPLLALPLAVEAQTPLAEETATPRVSVLAGPVGSRSLVGGWHAGIAVRQPLADRVALRGQGVVASGDVRGLSALMGLEADVWRGVYATGGVGAYFDDGTRGAWSLGLGSGVELLSRPMALEVQYVSTDGGGLYWGIRTPLVR